MVDFAESPCNTCRLGGHMVAEVQLALARVKVRRREIHFWVGAVNHCVP